MTHIKMNPLAHIIDSLSVLQNSAYPHLSRGVVNEAAMPELSIQNELLKTQLRHLRLSQLRTPMATDDFNSDGENRKFLTSFKEFCLKIPMKKLTRTIAKSLFPGAVSPFRVSPARGNFYDDKCHHTHTVSILRYLTHPHKERSYILSEVLKTQFWCVWGPFWGSLWS